MHYIVGTKSDEGKVTVVLEQIGDDGNATAKTLDQDTVKVSGYLGVDAAGHLVLAEAKKDLPAVPGATDTPSDQKE
jgi:hypothetical protein